MKILKQLVMVILAVGLWGTIALYGGLSGWWLSALAPEDDAAAFMQTAIAIRDENSAGNAALVLIEKNAVFDEYYGASKDEIDPETLFPVASLSKWITAYGVMQLVEEGIIALDAPISDYLTRWQLPESDFNNEAVTVRMLLAHTAGLTDGLGFADYDPTEVLPSIEDSLTNPRASDGHAEIALGREPGTEWEYSGGGYLILQLLVEEVSGMSFEAWMQQAVFDPIGMSRSTYDYLGELDNISNSYDGSGQPAQLYRYAAAAATGLSSSAADLVKFARVQVSTDREQAELLSEEAVTAMREPHGQMMGFDIWGLGVMLYAPTRSGDYVFGHDGSNEPAINSALRINPDNGDAIIVLATGSELLASSIAYEWTLWQTGMPDFLMVDKAVESALLPFAIGTALIVFIFLAFKRRKTLHHAVDATADDP